MSQMKEQIKTPEKEQEIENLFEKIKKITLP